MEKRELAAKPQWSLRSWFSGEYAEQYDAYYADTFPPREQLVSLASKLEQMQGVHPDDVRIHPAGGNAQQSQQLPQPEPEAEQEPQQELAEEPLQMLLDKEVEIAPVELSELVQTVQSQDSALVLLESSHQLKPAYLMMQTGLYGQLTPKQQAAVEQAVVMACGYCRTVADQNRQENLEQLRQLGVQIEPVNREKYLALLADIYQYDAGNMLYRPDAELDQMVRSDAVKYSVS